MLRFSNEWLRERVARDPDVECEAGSLETNTMTTSVKVHVNGQYRATVKQDGQEPVVVEGNYNGGSGERTFWLPHPAKATFEISEEYVQDNDKRPAS
jgi:hypothetical protein